MNMAIKVGAGSYRIWQRLSNIRGTLLIITILSTSLIIGQNEQWESYGQDLLERVSPAIAKVASYYWILALALILNMPVSTYFKLPSREGTKVRKSDLVWSTLGILLWGLLYTLLREEPEWFMSTATWFILFVLCLIIQRHISLFILGTVICSTMSLFSLLKGVVSILLLVSVALSIVTLFSNMNHLRALNHNRARWGNLLFIGVLLGGSLVTSLVGMSSEKISAVQDKSQRQWIGIEYSPASVASEKIAFEQAWVPFVDQVIKNAKAEVKGAITGEKGCGYTVEGILYSGVEPLPISTAQKTLLQDMAAAVRAGKCKDFSLFTNTWESIRANPELYHAMLWEQARTQILGGTNITLAYKKAQDEFTKLDLRSLRNPPLNEALSRVFRDLDIKGYAQLQLAAVAEIFVLFIILSAFFPQIKKPKKWRLLTFSAMLGTGSSTICWLVGFPLQENVLITAYIVVVGPIAWWIMSKIVDTTPFTMSAKLVEKRANLALVFMIIAIFEMIRIVEDWETAIVVAILLTAFAFWAKKLITGKVTLLLYICAMLTFGYWGLIKYEFPQQSALGEIAEAYNQNGLDDNIHAIRSIAINTPPTSQQKEDINQTIATWVKALAAATAKAGFRKPLATIRTNDRFRDVAQAELEARNNLAKLFDPRIKDAWIRTENLTVDQADELRSIYESVAEQNPDYAANFQWKSVSMGPIEAIKKEPARVALPIGIFVVCIALITLLAVKYSQSSIRKGLISSFYRVPAKA